MRRVIVGTAGHIDHGKTRLVEALTGIDCDRWAAEKERGITIDLGFAHLEEGDFQIGFVDVPGHERFLHNALAGLGGIRIMLLVVAADEGVKPQTREHLAICSLLGIPTGLVALTKADLAAPDLRELARIEIDELLGGTPYAGAPIVTVSAATGDGVEELKARILELAELYEAVTDPGCPARLPIDRAFHLKGLGLVVTGTLAAGAVREGDVLSALPGAAKARVRGVQVHGGERQVAEAGERTALQLAGIEIDAARRGVQLVEPGGYAPAVTLAARLDLLPEAPRPLRGSTPVRFHLLSSEVQGRMRPLAGPIEPGERGAVEIRLARPVVAARGDRFIVRRPSPPTTLGGGRILDPQWHRRRGAAVEAALEALGRDEESALALWAAEAGEAGLAGVEAARRLGRTEDLVERRLDSLTAAGRLVEVPAGQGHGRRWLDPSALDRVAERAAEVLQDYFRDERLARGMPKAEAVGRILPGRGAELADFYLARLEKRRVAAVRGDRVDLPGREAELTEKESDLARALRLRLEEAGLTPPSPAELARELGAKPQILDGVVRYLLERGRLTRLPNGLILSSAAVEALADELRATGWERFRVPQFKDRFGLTRKWAIPLLEHLDSLGVTRRLGDERQVLRVH